MNWFSLMMLVTLVVVNAIAGFAIKSKWLNPMASIRRILAAGTFNLVFMIYAFSSIAEPEEFRMNDGHMGFEGVIYDLYGWATLLAIVMLVVCCFSYLFRVPGSKEAGRKMAGW